MPQGDESDLLRAAGIDPETLAGLDDQGGQAEDIARELAAARARVAAVPAATIVANHVMGLYELAAIHLGQETPDFTEATVAIDAMAAVLDRLPGRLGDEEDTLRHALSQLRLAFVSLKGRIDSPLDDD
jgi:hypothetical protein